MTMRASGPGEVHVIDRWEGGAGWIAHPEEDLLRASHVLTSNGEAWLVDPLDADGLDEWLEDFGDVAGVVVLLHRHKRDAAAIARRHGVAVHVPEWFSDVATELDAPVEVLGESLADTGYEVVRIADTVAWHEAALFDPIEGTLVVPESLGTTDYFRAEGERVGVHPLRRLTPPRMLADLDVYRLLVGHGEGVFEDADEAVDEAVTGSRRNAPSLYARTVRSLFE